jgi:hypothetical protein
MTLALAFTAWHEDGALAWVGAFGVVFFGYALIHAIRIVKNRLGGRAEGLRPLPLGLSSISSYGRGTLCLGPWPVIRGRDR